MWLGGWLRDVDRRLARLEGDRGVACSARRNRRSHPLECFEARFRAAEASHRFDRARPPRSDDRQDPERTDRAVPGSARHARRTRPAAPPRIGDEGAGLLLTLGLFAWSPRRLGCKQPQCCPRSARKLVAAGGRALGALFRGGLGLAELCRNLPWTRGAHPRSFGILLGTRDGSASCAQIASNTSGPCPRRMWNAIARSSAKPGRIPTCEHVDDR